MAFTYTDYMSSAYTPAQRIERCRLFIAELTAEAAKPNISADGRSIDRTGLQAMLTAAKSDLLMLESDPRANRRGGTSRALIF